MKGSKVKTFEESRKEHKRLLEKGWKKQVYSGASCERKMHQRTFHEPSFCRMRQKAIKERVKEHIYLTGFRILIDGIWT